jgi:hypothetical protein
VLVVVTETAEVVVVVDVGGAVVVTEAVVDACDVVVIGVVAEVEVVAVVVEELQDARIRDKIKMPVRITQFLPLFIKSSSFIKYLGNRREIHFYNILLDKSLAVVLSIPLSRLLPGLHHGRGY